MAECPWVTLPPRESVTPLVVECEASVGRVYREATRVDVRVGPGCIDR